MLNRKIDKHLYNSYSEDIPTFLKKIYAARAVTEKQLELSLSKLLKPNFKNLDLAINSLKSALYKQKRILIIGDFDADGATASALAVKALRLMGAKFVDFLVPNRFKHGYGLTVEIVNKAKKEKDPNLIITVDNGISSIEGTLLARSLNIDVIITDHHLPSLTIPEANAIINPNLKGCKFASKNLSGVGVCFYLFSALKSHLQQDEYFNKIKIPPPDLRQLLDLVALGTIADVVKLDQNNRILVNAGLKRINKGLCSLGILAILELTKQSAASLKASDLGFIVAPRINAAGRLDDISQGIRCLLANNINDARRYAVKLENFNIKRRIEQEKMQNDALTIINKKPTYKKPFAIALFDETWHEGIVGIIAGKLKEIYRCPCVVFAKSNKLLKGSIRSIPEVHIKDLLDLIDKKHPNLIEKFGGHAMAAGLTIKAKNLLSFKKKFKNTIKTSLKKKLPAFYLLTDGMLAEQEITLHNAQLIDDAAPWGQGFEEPIFHGEFEIVSQKTLLEKHLKYNLRLYKQQQVYNAIAFFQTPIKAKKVLVRYKLEVNEWRGSRSLQLLIQTIEKFA